MTFALTLNSYLYFFCNIIAKFKLVYLCIFYCYTNECIEVYEIHKYLWIRIMSFEKKQKYRTAIKENSNISFKNENLYSNDWFELSREK